MLIQLSDAVGPERGLLICCSAFRCDLGQFGNLTVRKIPKAVLRKCEWGHDDYSLVVENLPPAPPGHDEPVPGQGGQPTRRSRGNVDDGQLQFELEGE